VLHLMEGGDYGWRTSYQHLEGFGPWVQEELWKGGKGGILPLAGTVSQGPSGLAFYPGTGFGDRLKGKFLHCDFPGGVWEFSVKPKGASFEVDTKEKFLWNCWPTDVDFGPDGAAYVLDWVSGWGQTPRGRIYRITPNAEVGKRDADVVAEVRRLLGEGMSQREEKELLQLLGQADRRVRLEAQWELAGRGVISLSGLSQIAEESQVRLQRLHALWAMGQIARGISATSSPIELAVTLVHLVHLLEDPDRRVAAEAARALADAGFLEGWAGLTSLLSDPDSVVRRVTGQAWASRPLGRSVRPQPGMADTVARLIDQPWAHPIVASYFNPQRQAPIIGPLEAVERLIQGQEEDLFLQQVARRILQQGLTLGPYFVDPLRVAATNALPAVRQIALLTQRHMAERVHYAPEWPGFPHFRTHAAAIGVQLTNFLTDSNPRLIEEAGRAIHDVPIAEGFPALASFITKIDCPPQLHTRVINACFRLGTQQHAQMLASFAVREDVSDTARVRAVRALADWGQPGPLDRVNGLWRPLVTVERGARTTEGAEPGVSPSTKSNPLLERAAQAARNFGRAAEVPRLPDDLGRSVPFEEGLAVKRNPVPARRAFLRVAGDLLNPFNLTESGVPAGTREVLSLQIATAEAAAKLQVKEASSPLFDRFIQTNSAPELRRALLPALAALRAAQTPDAVKLALADSDPKLRAAALPFLDQLEGEDSVGLLAGLLPRAGGGNTNAELRLAQAALAVLARVPGPAADSAVAGQLEILLAGTLSPSLKLDVLAAAEERSKTSPALTTLLVQARAREPADDLLARWRYALAGGDATRGREFFLKNPTVQCLRCHQVGAEGGTVGPNLTDIGRRYPREYLLESIVLPNARIGTGFETAVVTVKSGESHVGVVKEETDTVLVLEVTDGETSTSANVTLPKSEIARRERGLSAMPEGLVDQITRFELRDLVEYLAGLQ